MKNDTIPIEEQLKHKIHPLFILLYNSLADNALSAFTNYGVLSVDSIIDNWLATNSNTIREAIAQSLRDCAIVAHDYINSSNYINTMFDAKYNKLFDATRQQYNDIVNYLRHEFNQLMTFIEVYPYTVYLTNIYLSSLESSLNNKLNLTNVNSTLKNYGIILKVSSVNSGIPGFYWQTMQDERVRPSHAALDGKYFTWDNLPQQGLPGTEINCRCKCRILIDEK